MLTILDNTEASEPDLFGQVNARLKEELEPIKEKRQQGSLALLRAKRDQMRRAKGLGEMELEERLFRADYEGALLKSGLHISIDALSAEIDTRERAAADFAKAAEQAQGELERLNAERDRLGKLIEKQANNLTYARDRMAREKSLAREKRKERSSYLALAEMHARGEKVVLWREPDRSEPLNRPASATEGVPLNFDAWYSDPQYRVRWKAENDEILKREDEHWKAMLRARELTCTLEQLRLLEENDKPQKGAA
jgi:hypothetical protein